MQKRKKSFVGTILFFVILIAAEIILTRCVIINAKIPSESMEPTVMAGDRIFGDRLAYIKKDPQRYDVVIFIPPDEPNRIFIKRVIGLPGDEVEIKDGAVFVNGEKTDDSFCMPGSYTDPGYLTEPFTVPDDCYFVLGDNRNNSADARFWSTPFVEKDKILAKAGFRYYPFNKIGEIG